MHANKPNTHKKSKTFLDHFLHAKLNNNKYQNVSKTDINTTKQYIYKTKL